MLFMVEYSLHPLRIFLNKDVTTASVNYTSILDLLKKESQKVGTHKFSLHFLYTEWEHIVDAWQLESRVVFSNC